MKIKEKNINDFVLKGKGGRMSSQELFLSLGQDRENYVNEILLWGTRAGGKTHSLILDFITSVLKFKHKSFKGILFRITYNALDDVIDKALTICNSIFKEDEFTFYKSTSDLRIVFHLKNCGKQELLFRRISTLQDYEQNFHGKEFQKIYWDELSSWSTLELYDIMMTCLRYSKDPEKEFPLTVRATTNPWGLGIDAIEKRFLKEKPGVITEKSINIGNEKITTKKMNIFSSWVENYKIGPEYIINIAKGVLNDKSKRDAFLSGIIDRTSGSFFGELLSRKVIIKPFDIPKSWARSAIMGYDDGTASPFSTLWLVKSDGTSYKDHNGDEKWCKKGSCFIVNEYFGAESLDTCDVGLNLSHTEIARNIKAINEGKVKNILSGRVANCGPSDTSIHSNTRGKGEKTVYDIFKGEGLNWKKTKKFNGSRINGANIIRDMLTATNKEDLSSEHLYIFDSCKFLVYNLNNLKRNPKNPDDILEENKDHDYDVLRYLVTFENSGKMVSYS